ncbi:Pentatricopeptide repeat domain-containing protein 3, mitochondrial [Mizuhopecten yessoensis]|uniref:Small ribosomal subunit protein mS39 n=1 Tax=Mizuhopecten yessoensis TaxID=6573 RepID=A0A210R4X6_MIZYE|nr:Pentatricopeptide repeat domain-containing protein 3, mitochondrial [Mizuhopecten yessoensis]
MTQDLTPLKHRPTLAQVKLLPVYQQGIKDSVSILQALSEVAGKDHTVPDYKPTYTDDRFVIPYNQKAQSFRFALTSGRVSAQYFIQHFPECFATKKSVPHILALEPKQGRAKVEGTSEEALQEKIQINLVADAMQMYEKIIDEGGSVAIETTEDLVDMIMFNFGQEQDKITTNPFNLQIASAWSHPEQIPGDFLQEFLELVRTEKTSRMYKSIILGFCKFEHMTTALDYYEEMKSKGFQYDRDIIHALLSPNPPWSNKMPLPASTARNLLKDMKTAGIAPTEETFRRLVSGPGSYCPDISFFTEIFNEMKALGMKPSLSMCQVFLKFSHEKSDFEQILNFVEKENIKATSENEMGFFVDAMLLSDSEFRSPEYALRVDTLFRALGESYYFETVDESRRYYRSFIVVFLKYETLENILEIYERVVPHGSSSCATGSIIPCHSVHHPFTQGPSSRATVSIIPCRRVRHPVPQGSSSRATGSIIPGHSVHHTLPQCPSSLHTGSIIPCHRVRHPVPQGPSSRATVSIIPCHSVHHPLPQGPSSCATGSIIPCHRVHHPVPQGPSSHATVSIIPCDRVHHPVPQGPSSCATGFNIPCHRVHHPVPQGPSSRATGSIVPCHRVRPPVPQGPSSRATGSIIPCHRVHHPVPQGASSRATGSIIPCHRVHRPMPQGPSSTSSWLQKTLRKIVFRTYLKQLMQSKVLRSVVTKVRLLTPRYIRDSVVTKFRLSTPHYKRDSVVTKVRLSTRRYIRDSVVTKVRLSRPHYKRDSVVTKVRVLTNEDF